MGENIENNEVETEVSVPTEDVQDVTFEEGTSSGPSKGFLTFIAGGVVAIAVGATVAISRHKKKKADAKAKTEDPIVVDVEIVEEKTADDGEPEVVEEAKPEGKSEKKK